jgi:hypothetical protein
MVVTEAGIMRDRTFPNVDDERLSRLLDATLRTAFRATVAAAHLPSESAMQETPRRGTGAYRRRATSSASWAEVHGRRSVQKCR